MNLKNYRCGHAAVPPPPSRGGRARFTRAAGFTLIELLVVIAIIGVLAGLAFSVYGSVQKNGKATQCVSNLRQIYTAMNLYAQDHANTLPQRAYTQTDAQGDGMGYTELILGYIDPGSTPGTSATAKKIFTCPSQTNPSYPSEPGYGMNWFYDNVNLAVVSQPAETILLTDTLGQGGTGSRRADRDNTSDDIGRLDPTRHQGKANYMFFDGHLSRLTYAETRVPLNPSTVTPPPDMWGTDFGQHTQDLPAAYSGNGS